MSMDWDGLQLNEETGCFSICFSGGEFKNLHAQVRLQDGTCLKTTDMKQHTKRVSEEKTEIGGCRREEFIHEDGGRIRLIQQFDVYADYITIRLLAEGEDVLSTNCMTPLCGCGEEPVLVMKEKDIRFLSAPFDNDKWAKFVDYPVKYSGMSYEFTVVHPEKGNSGLVMGSVDHDCWKTGFQAAADKDGSIVEFRGISGVATEDTRDLDGAEHGWLSGTQVCSSRIFLGWFEDTRDGLQAFGKANAAVKPALPWEGPVIFGWNSWAALMGKVTFEKYKEACDFMKSIKDTYQGSDGKQYVNYDAAWGSFTNKMRDSVAYAEANGQEPGTYYSPFITHEHQFKQEVPGTNGNYLFEDLLLRDKDGKILPQIDGLYSLDPTHPGTMDYISYETDNIIKWGFRSVKTDFVGHGCREGVFYNKDITTGVQAFNFGMSHFVACLSEERAGYPIFISLSIAPIMPHGYGHARRISCDAFGSLDQSAYLNNCITYLWWMNDCLYRFNDPDHIVTYKTYDKHSTTLEEGRTRYHTGVICGSLMLTSDDYGIPEARERAREVLTNEEINAVARKGESFRPVSGAQGEFAADVFARKDEDAVVVAAFNYSLSDERQVVIPVEEIGLEKGQRCKVKDLWTKKVTESEDGYVRIKLIPAQSVMIKVYS